MAQLASRPGSPASASSATRGSRCVGATEPRRKVLDRSESRHPQGRASASGRCLTGRGPSRPSPSPDADASPPLPRPLCADNLFGHLAATAVPGVEEMRDGAYRRTLRLPHGVGLVALRPAEDCIWASLSLGDLRDLTSAVARCRRLLDLDADPEATDQLLCEGTQRWAPLAGWHRVAGCPARWTRQKWRSGPFSANRCPRRRRVPTRGGSPLRTGSRSTTRPEASPTPFRARSPWPRLYRHHRGPVQARCRPGRGLARRPSPTLVELL